MWRGALLLLLCLCTFLLGLGRTAIVDSDEAFYAGAGREMVASGDWITPHYNFETRLNKPILYYWLVAGTFKVGGVTETAARLWAALSGVGLALLAFLVGRRWVNDGTGFVAGAIVATSIGVVLLARQALPDIPLALFISLAIWSAIEATTSHAIGISGAPKTGPHLSRRSWLLVAAASLALGLITKGPIAIALPVVAVVPIVVWERFTRRADGSTATLPLSVLDLAAAAAVFIAIAAPWYVAVTRVHGLDFLSRFFLHENLDRFASETFNERRLPFFYFGVMAGGLLPWTAFGLLVIGPTRDVLMRRRRLSATTARLLAWVVGPLLLLSASVGSQPRYILPCIVPVALLLGRSIWMRAAEQPAAHRDLLFTSATTLAGAVLVILGALVLRVKPILVGVNPDWSPIGAFTMIAAGAITIAAALFGPRRIIPTVVAVASCATVIAFNATVLRTGRPEAVEQIAAAIRQQDPADALCACGAFARNLTFYTQLPVYVGGNEPEFQRFLERPGTVLAVLNATELARIEANLQRQFPRLAAASYLDPELWQGGALLNPDPALYLKRVVLVSNR